MSWERSGCPKSNWKYSHEAATESDRTHRYSARTEQVARKAAFRVPGADSQGDRHDECGGESEHQLAQKDQDARRLPERGRGDQVALSGTSGGGQEDRNTSRAGARRSTTSRRRGENVLTRPWWEAGSKAASAFLGLCPPCCAQEHFLSRRKNQEYLAENEDLHKNQGTTNRSGVFTQRWHPPQLKAKGTDQRFHRLCQHFRGPPG